MATASGTISDPATARSIASAQGMVGKVGHVAQKAVMDREDLPPALAAELPRRAKTGSKAKSSGSRGGAHSPARQRRPPPPPRRWLVRPLVLIPSIPIIFTTAGGAATPSSGPVRRRGGRVPDEPPRGAREERRGPPSPRYGGGGCGARLVGLSMKVLRTRGGRGQAREWQGNGMGATMAMVPRHGLGLSKGGVCLA